MNAAEPRSGTTSRREWAFIAAMTAIGLAVRIWGLGRLGLVHFDEGIYAIAGLWSMGSGGIDPLVIPYAPAGFPGLVGLSYLLFGPSDAAAILVSIATGTLAIPASAWLARRTFGPGAGAVAAALAAFSAFHVAFSRMALTDATATLAWLLGLIAVQRFLERPGLGSAVALGLATGAAQWVKYSGWTIGGVAALGAAATVAFDPAFRSLARARSYLAWGLAAAAVAAMVYAPWFAFVERHGGYSALMTHHRGYMGTLATWPSHGLQQLRQSAALSGGFPWNGASWSLAAIGAVIVARGEGRGRRATILLAAGVAATLAPTTLWWLGPATLVFAPTGSPPAARALGTAWVGMSLLTPFYHPYARLWLPLESLGWIAAAGLVREGDRPVDPGFRRRLAMIAACCGAALTQSLAWPSARLPGPLGPSDSLRVAVARAGVELGAAPNAPVRVLARPPARFYLRVPSRVEPDAAGLLKGGGGWALVDLAQLRQSGDASELGARLLQRWDKVAEHPTTLNSPTLLDVDPDAAVDSRPGRADAPLWLLRPRPGAR